MTEKAEPRSSAFFIFVPNKIMSFLPPFKTKRLPAFERDSFFNH